MPTKPNDPTATPEVERLVEEAANKFGFTMEATDPNDTTAAAIAIRVIHNTIKGIIKEAITAALAEQTNELRQWKTKALENSRYSELKLKEFAKRDKDAENTRLRGALELFARLADVYERKQDWELAYVQVCFLRKAKEALAPPAQSDERKKE